VFGYEEEVAVVLTMNRRWNLLKVWPLSLTVLFLVTSNCGLANGKRFIGCLFQNGLCQVGKEWCYDGKRIFPEFLPAI